MTHLNNISDSLPTAINLSQKKVSGLVDAFVSVNKVTRSWGDLENEIKDVIFFKVGYSQNSIHCILYVI